MQKKSQIVNPRPNHLHVYMTLERSFPFVTLFSLACWLGSDPRRECANYARLNSGAKKTGLTNRIRKGEEFQRARSSVQLSKILSKYKEENAFVQTSNRIQAISLSRRHTSASSKQAARLAKRSTLWYQKKRLEETDNLRIYRNTREHFV